MPNLYRQTARQALEENHGEHARSVSFHERMAVTITHSQAPKEDDELTHVGPGTPAGEYLRRFWQPPEEDEKLMRETGRRLAEEYVATRSNGNGAHGK